jgi:hypothetical protein
MFSIKLFKWGRFALRTLLILAPAVGIWLGLIMAAARQQQNAVKAIQAAGGNIDYDFQKVTIGGVTGIDVNAPMPGPAWIRKLLGDDYFITAIDVMLDGDQVTDDLIQMQVASLSHLEDLRVNSQNFSGHGFQAVAGLKTLKWLWVVSPQITVDDVRQLAHLRNLKSLHIYHNLRSERLADPKTSVEFADMPVSEVLKYLVDQHHIPMRFDPGPESPNLDPPITAEIHDVSLEDALKEMLQPSKLDYVVRKQAGGFVITTPKIAREKWPGYAAMHDLFPNFLELDADW